MNITEVRQQIDNHLDVIEQQTINDAHTDEAATATVVAVANMAAIAIHAMVNTAQQLERIANQLDRANAVAEHDLGMRRR